MNVMKIFGVLLVLAVSTLAEARPNDARRANVIGQLLEQSWGQGLQRNIFERLPKGGDIHTHLRGAVYAENWIDWAAEDGLCVDLQSLALRLKEEATCEASNWAEAADVASDSLIRKDLINSMSMSSYIPTSGWSGHDQFFATFGRIAVSPERWGDQYAAVANRAGWQNILYLELMQTLVLPELFPLVAGLELTGDAADDYAKLMASPFGGEVDALVERSSAQIKEALTKKDQLLGCGTDDAKPGCDVELRFLHQVIREFPPQMVYAQIALGWAVMENEPLVVGLNLVAPEDGFIALRDYTQHMQMIDHLYTNRSKQNVTLHAGELAMGLVPPKELRFHIRQAIEVGHAKRIGHAVALPYEDDLDGLIKMMQDRDTLIEVNLTSNDTILGISGGNHPLKLLRLNVIPYTLSTDDEGVSRIDLTHEYQRFYNTYQVSYLELRAVSRNGLTYSFLDGASLWDMQACMPLLDAEDLVLSGECADQVNASDKARLQWKLEERLRAFEQESQLRTFKPNRFGN